MNNNMIRKWSQHSYRRTLNEEYFIQVRKEGRTWISEIRITESGDLVKISYGWKTKKAAFEEANMLAERL